MGKSKYTPEQVIAKFWSRVDKSEGENSCWAWTAARTPRNYGVFRLNGRSQHAHRVAWQITHGAIPENMVICHHCDNPPCVNPSHLFLGTQADNIHDMIRKGRGSITGYPNQARGVNHGRHTQPEKTARGERIAQHKLSQDDVIAIRTRHQNGGVTYSELAKEYKVSVSTIRCIIARKWWNHI